MHSIYSARLQNILLFYLFSIFFDCSLSTLLLYQYTIVVGIFCYAILTALTPPTL